MKAMISSAMPLLVALLLTVSPGCGRHEDLSPPKVLYGQAECDLCRMIISDEPFAAAAVIETADGVRKVAFDDIGCLLEFLRQGAGEGVTVTGHVHDYESRTWIPAADAIFIHSEQLQTPMASNLAACASATDADALLGRFSGKVARLPELLATAVEASHSKQERNHP